MFSSLQGTKVQGVIFNDVVEKIGKNMKKNKSYFIKNGNVKSANTKFPSVNSDIEISLSHSSEIEEPEDSSNFNMLKFDFVEFQAIPSLVDEKTLIGM